ncbi:DUF2505 domain-containing protein [Amycolatopsis panacis]|uniref:DUF2505 domain-containing protein n=1 Tax=Amycolatopsis panacis TaxID=2340917 RepID=A0A419I1C4_9PSEU|nr:DUF2505 domain-containing protein [Amycolatopsis panacis]RJQ83475.1 DUF2505 domain-containing protein [Amycolatopsis panacis]
MGSRIEHRGEFSGTLAEVFLAVSGEEAVRARLSALGGDNGKLLSYTGEGDSVRYELEHGINAARLPQAVRALIKGDIIVRRTQTWQRSGESYTGRTDVSVGGVPGEIGAQTSLAPSAEKVIFRTSGEVVVRIPLFGGRIEEFVSEQVTSLLRREDEFTAQWLADHR